MKKKVFSLLVGLAMSLVSMAQATLPTSCDFTGAVLPADWTANGAEFYTASGNTAPAMKFAATGKYLIINFAGTPGTLKYDVAGNSFGTGTFDVQESADGVTYSTIKTHNASDISGTTAYATKTVALSGTSRFVKFIYTLKASGNVGLDNVSITEGATTAQQMKVNINGSSIGTASTHFTGANVGSSSTLPFTIQNAGSQDALVVNSITFSGANSSEFSLVNTPTFPATVAALSTSNVGIQFTPTAAGSRTATVTITSNDIDNPTFTFNLVGYGDMFATEPAAQPTALTFSAVKSYRFNVAFTGSTAEGFLVLRKNGAAVTEVPQDGVVYKAGDMIGGAKVVKANASTGFTPNDIVANNTYHFAVFAYNGVGAYTNYKTSSPLIGSQATLANMIPAGEYDNITVTSPTLINDLHGLVAPHTQVYYSNYAARVIEKFYERDTVNGKKTLTCLYTGGTHDYESPFNFAASGISREHTFANSWFPIDNSDANFYSDIHNLFPVHQNNANAVRSNYPFGIVVSDTIQRNGNSYFGKDAQGNWVYEPRDEQKGDLARAMFYMCTRYTENGTTWKLPAYISSTINYGQDQAVLKLWNTQDPPSSIEIARNDYIDSLQKNRNPFIDHPEYACYIDFGTMTHLINGCNGLNVTTAQLEQAFMVYPNPTKSTVTIAVDGTTMIEYRIFDLQGRMVKKEFLSDAVAKEVNVSSLTTGTYLISVTTEHGDVTKKLTIE